jgi:hypothetical protein
MPKLTRRRYPERPNCWHVYYGAVHVGTVAISAGAPFDVDQWEWQCGFYPGCEPGQHTNGSAVDFSHARAEFEDAWKRLLPTRTEANFQEWRDAKDWTARKYAMWERGELLPSQKPSSMMGCPCGARFNSRDPASNQIHCPHIYAAQAADGIRR